MYCRVKKNIPEWFHNFWQSSQVSIPWTFIHAACSISSNQVLTISMFLHRWIFIKTMKMHSGIFFHDKIIIFVFCDGHQIPGYQYTVERLVASSWTIFILYWNYILAAPALWKKSLYLWHITERDASELLVDFIYFQYLFVVPHGMIWHSSYCMALCGTLQKMIMLLADDPMTHLDKPFPHSVPFQSE